MISINGFLEETHNVLTGERWDGKVTMKRNNRNRTRTAIAPLKIELSEAEIMADLKYPTAVDRHVTARPASPRNFNR